MDFSQAIVIRFTLLWKTAQFDKIKVSGSGFLGKV